MLHRGSTRLWVGITGAQALELLRYLAVSALALMVDWGLLAALTEWGRLHYMASAAIGFTAGLAVAYVLSILFVFPMRRYGDARVEFLVFCLVGVAGLGLTQIVMHALVNLAAVPYLVAKLPTAGAVFVFNFIVRRHLLFSPDQRASTDDADAQGALP